MEQRTAVAIMVMVSNMVSAFCGWAALGVPPVYGPGAVVSTGKVERGEGHGAPPRTHHVSDAVEQAGLVLDLGLAGRHGVRHGLPVAGTHGPARAGLGLHAGGGERGRHGLGIGHLAGDGGQHPATLRQGEADVLVTRADGGGGQGQALAPRRLAHVHPAAVAVGGVSVAAGLHHLAVPAERLVALDGAEQGGERGREEVRDLHGECFLRLGRVGYGGSIRHGGRGV
jgi:hypothetical protein